MNIEETPPLKFEDCKLCRFKRRPKICTDCDSGELFEERGPAALNFSDDRPYDPEPNPDAETFVPSQSVLRHLTDLFCNPEEYDEEEND